MQIAACWIRRWLVPTGTESMGCWFAPDASKARNTEYSVVKPRSARGSGVHCSTPAIPEAESPVSLKDTGLKSALAGGMGELS